MSVTPQLPDPEAEFAERDRPSPAFIEDMRRRFPTERETDELLVRKLQRRAGPPYSRITRGELKAHLSAMLEEVVGGDFVISGERWFTGGVSKIQLGFTLDWNEPQKGPRREQMMIRMDPSESTNATSRLREWEILRAMKGTVPVPETFWLDEHGKWFPEPALVYAFVPGVTKPPSTTSGRISGLGTQFGEHYRSLLGPQFVDYLAKIHTFPHQNVPFTSLDRPAPGTTEGALWQLNRARRLWEEDRGEDYPLMEVAANWLERNMPVVDHVSLVHGDYRSGNFLFDEQTGRIDAWLDWERAHLGDRHRDLAWTTQEIMGHYGEDGKTYYVCGLVPLDEFYRRYEDASGLSVDPDRLAWYRILNCYQIVVSTLASAYRIVRLGKSHQEILLARIKGQTPSVMNTLRRMLQERM